MSQTLGTTRQNVRFLMGDLRLGDPAVSSFRLDDIISRKAMTISARLYGGATVSAGAVTVVAGTCDYSLGASNQHSALSDPIWDATGQPLTKVSMEDADEMRRGSTVPTAAIPLFYALWEDDSTNVLYLRLLATPSASGTLTLRRSVLPTAPTTDSSTISMSDLALRALEWQSAAAAVATLTDEQAANLGIAKSVIGQWERDAEAALEGEQSRLGLAKRQAAVVRRNA